MNDAGNIVARIFDGSSRTVMSSARGFFRNMGAYCADGDGGNMKLYINGLLDRTLTTGHAITNYSPRNLSLDRQLKLAITLRTDI
jgi:hypothetical protein